MLANADLPTNERAVAFIPHYRKCIRGLRFTPPSPPLSPPALPEVEYGPFFDVDADANERRERFNKCRPVLPNSSSRPCNNIIITCKYKQLLGRFPGPLMNVAVLRRYNYNGFSGTTMDYPGVVKYYVTARHDSVTFSPLVASSIEDRHVMKLGARNKVLAN